MYIAVANKPDKDVSKQPNKFLQWLWPDSGAVSSIPAADGLRGVAVLLTVLYHLFNQFGASYPNSNLTSILLKTINIWFYASTGVHLFFVLSGFLLFLPYVRAYYNLQKKPSISKFYVRRALRILPAYIVSLFLIVIFFKPEFLNISQIPNIAIHLVMLHDLTDSMRFDINPPYWTMAVESRFYLILPLIALVIGWAIERKKRWLVIGIFIGLVASSPLYSLSITVVKHFIAFILQYMTFFELLDYLCCFAGGMLVAWLYIIKTINMYSALTTQRIIKSSKIAGVLSIILLIIDIAIHFLQLPLFGKFELLFTNIILAFCYTGLLMGTILGWKNWENFFSIPALRFIGVISYSLYIWNQIFFAYFIVPIAIKLGDGIVPIIASILMSILILIPFCYIFYQLVERPFIRLRKKQH